MSEFKCPSCSAKVKKAVTDKPGCPCCGFGQPHGHASTNEGKCDQCHESYSRCRGHTICG